MSGLIHGKMADILAEVDAIEKGQRNKEQGFNFRGYEDVYAALHPLLAKHRVVCAPTAVTIHRRFGTSQKGGVVTHVWVHVTYLFTAEDGSTLAASAIGEGRDYADKATGKAMSNAHKYVLLQTFAIPTRDAPDSDSGYIEMQERDAQRVADATEQGRQQRPPQQARPQHETSGGTSRERSDRAFDQLEAGAQPSPARAAGANGGSRTAAETAIRKRIADIVKGDVVRAKALISAIATGKETIAQCNDLEFARLDLATAVIPIWGGTLEAATAFAANTFQLPPFAQMTQDQINKTWAEISAVTSTVTRTAHGTVKSTAANDPF